MTAQVTVQSSEALTFSWTDPTTNTDGSAVAAGEITAYTIGIRQVADAKGNPVAGSVAGTYPTTISAPGAAAVSALGSSLAQALPAGTYAAAIQANGPVNSAFSNEVQFAIVPPPPTPSAPTNFLVA